MKQIPLHGDPERTTPLGVARYASDFLEAAHAAYQERSGTWPGPHVASVPVMFLIGQSIELSLKAYLLHKGATLAEIRSREFGHNLGSCYAKAKELGFAALIELQDTEESGMETLDELYSSKQLQYIVTGAKTFPSYEAINAVASKLLIVVAAQVGLRIQPPNNAA